MPKLTSELFAPKNVIVQGITGAHGSFQTKAMLTAGTHIVAGVTPGKAGQQVEEVPVYDRITDIPFEIDATVIFVPAPFAKTAVLEAIEARIPLIAIITENIPVHDMLSMQQQIKKMGESAPILLGPNSPGALVYKHDSTFKLGIIPAAMSLPGNTAIVSRSGTLTYETMAGLSARGIGQSYVIGIGGDQIHGLGFTDCLQLFQDDPEVDKIVLIGEIGGSEELQAAAYIKAHVTKPVFAYVAGHHAPTGVQLGHAGAILGSEQESAAAKTAALHAAGVKTAQSITELIKLV